MKQLVCEVCGSADLIKQEGAFVCRNCGCKYTVEEVRKLMSEGTVDASESTEKSAASDKQKSSKQPAVQQNSVTAEEKPSAETAAAPKKKRRINKKVLLVLLPILLVAVLVISISSNNTKKVLQSDRWTGLKTNLSMEFLDGGAMNPQELKYSVFGKRVTFKFGIIPVLTYTLEKIEGYPVLVPKSNLQETYVLKSDYTEAKKVVIPSTPEISVTVGAGEEHTSAKHIYNMYKSDYSSYKSQYSGKSVTVVSTIKAINSREWKLYYSNGALVMKNGYIELEGGWYIEMSPSVQRAAANWNVGDTVEVKGYICDVWSAYVLVMAHDGIYPTVELK